MHVRVLCWCVHSIRQVKPLVKNAILKGHTEYVYCLAVLSDGVTLASGSDDNTIKLWDTRTGACTRTLKGHTGRVYGLAVLSDGVSLASGSSDRTVRLWSKKTVLGLGGTASSMK